MYLYDIHTHKAEALSDAECQVKYILNTYPGDFHDKKSHYADCWFSCGIHPWNAEESDSRFDLLKDIVTRPEVVAIGEVGLDKLRGPDMLIQIEVFRKQIELAVSVNKPLIIHCVRAWDELISLYKDYQKHDIPRIIHGYRGNPEQTKQLSRLGFKFSIGEKFNRESLKRITVTDIFFETDMSGLTICKIYRNVSQEIGVGNNHFVILVAENISRTFG
jgi:TatD DNase family protein